MTIHIELIPLISIAAGVAILLVPRLLNYIVPDRVHVLIGGRIVKSGGKELALELEEKGYSWIEEEVSSSTGA